MLLKAKLKHSWTFFFLFILFVSSCSSAFPITLHSSSFASIHSFVRFFVRSFVRSRVRSLVRSFAGKEALREQRWLWNNKHSIRFLKTVKNNRNDRPKPKRKRKYAKRQTTRKANSLLFSSLGQIAESIDCERTNEDVVLCFNWTKIGRPQMNCLLVSVPFYCFKAKNVFKVGQRFSLDSIGSASSN